jgi:hypothetical protein
MKWGLVIVAILLILLVYCNSTDQVCAYDGRCYDVHGFRDKEEAAKLLADIHRFNVEFMRYLRAKYIWSDKVYPYTPHIKRLFHNYSPDILGENNPSSAVNTSYVMNKNEKMRFCLREKVSGKNKLLTLDELKFVVIHELSHMADENFGHTVSFWRVFKQLLIEAEQAGLYTPVDYSVKPYNYCGLIVNNNPYFMNF